MYRLLWRIRQQWNLLGFFEINEDHPLYQFTTMIKKGLRDSVQHAINHPVTADVRREDQIKAVLRQMHEGFEMRTYAAPAFTRFRKFLGMVDVDYQRSLTCDSSYLQFISNSKSTADFFLSNDKRYFLKTQSKQEIQFLLTNLPKYLEHMERNPHSILVKFLGVHSIIVPREKKRYFIIMQSIFYPHDKIVERYDIKGCDVGRWTDPTPKGSEIIVVYKDLNFADKTICLGPQRTWMLTQLELDTQFLKDLGVIDYSLLVGLQPLHEDERLLSHALANIIAMSIDTDSDHHNQNFGNAMYESHTSPSPAYSPSVDQFYKLSPESRYTIQNMLALYLKKRTNSDKESETSRGSETFMREVLAPYVLHGVSFDPTAQSSVTTEEDGHSPSISNLAESLFHLTQNRRLLPNTRNALHVIDGPDYRYYIGIVDLFTVYNFRKKMEHFWKTLRFRDKSFSTVGPVYYARRLCKWVQDHTT
ncbi:phosphatidylinositol 4-phosphate 5-kinase-like protein 1 isoform X1 [Zootoca vivipara]|uniref:phosphatidylinositol 4-phosphate 5-kinase-like protein 1 isoform X1 n=2 Tax=Zootoca vivipara TaxID=8524 RepID=UPI00293B905B|nr:phosphatidylinositol 4-phosphate 5-kinase-like protein 1 isoform X1 [Zootoca vivipara]